MTQLAVLGVRGKYFTVDLPQLLMVNGPNGCGKSTIADSLRLLFLGYVPAIGKKLHMLAIIMPGRRMRIELVFSDGRRCWREFTRTKDGKYESECHASWAPEKATQEEHHLAIQNLIAGDEVEAEEVLDFLRTFGALTANKRAARLQNLMEAGFDQTVVFKRVQYLTLAELKGFDDQTMQAMGVGAVARSVPGCDADGGQHSGTYAAWKSAMETTKANLGGDIQTAVTRANDEKRKATGECKDKVAAQREFQPKLKSLPEDDGGTLLRTKQTERTALEREIGAQTERREARMRRNQPVIDARAELVAAEKALEEAIASADSARRGNSTLSEIREHLREVESQMEKLVTPLEPDYHDSNALLEKADEIEGQISTIELPEVPNLADDERRLSDLRSQLASLEGSSWQKVLDIAKAIENDAKGTGARIVRLREQAELLRQIATEQGAIDTDALRAEADGLEGRLKPLQVERDRISALFVANSQKRDDLLIHLSGLRSECWRMAAQDFNTHNDNLRGHEKWEQRLSQQQTDLIRQIQDIENGVARADAASREASSAVKAARQRLEDLGAEEIADQEEDLDAKKALLDQQISALERTAGVRKEFETLQRECEEAEIAETVWKAVEKALRQVRGEALTAQAEPLLGRVRTFLAGAEMSEEPYLSVADGECKMGLIRVMEMPGEPGAEPVHQPVAIDIAAMCGGELTMFVAGMVGAMLAIRRRELRILLCEAAEVDDANTTALMKGLAAMSHELGHVIVMRRDKPSVPVLNWTSFSMESLADAA
ncbi:MAG TPA: hypothetical protein VMT89_00685 [Candidatus Acidoferrales bacterium]|nr:hypothetical protein [Candidatus Acidoferrales bacterium]